ncbi:hypothetical protein D3C75_1123140 [compost metagenome]
MNHHHGVLGHVHGVPSHGDHRGDTGSNAVDVDIDVSLVALKHAVYGLTCEHITAITVDEDIQH